MQIISFKLIRNYCLNNIKDKAYGLQPVTSYSCDNIFFKICKNNRSKLSNRLGASQQVYTKYPRLWYVRPLAPAGPCTVNYIFEL
jgi:hypothetical protein